MGDTIIPMGQMRKPRLTEGTSLGQGHTGVSGTAWAGIGQYNHRASVLPTSRRTTEMSRPLAKKRSKVGFGGSEKQKTEVGMRTVSYL